MKKPGILLLLLLVPVMASLAQQKESFDLATFTVPEGWTKVSATAEVVSYAITDNQQGTYCQIGIYRSIGSKGSAQSDFQREWQDLVVTTYKPSASAALVPAASRNGWDAQGGIAPFEFGGGQSVAMLVTMSGYSRSMSIVILTNTDGYQPSIEAFLDSVELGTPASAGKGAGGAGGASPRAQDAVQPNAAAQTTSSSFAFTSTTFDDGWSSTVREDWVEASRGSTRVLIHYPNKQADQYNSVVRDGLQTAWNVLVAPRYRNMLNLQLKPITGWQTIEFAEADAVEAASGNPVHVVLFKYDYSNGSGRYMEFITRDKNAFEHEFGPWHESSSGWDKMEKMSYYNRFAVAASDLKGTWTNDFSAAVQYVNAYTGADAGMATHASNEKFEFGPGNAYKWDLGVASGKVGSIKFQSAKSSGKFSLPSNWQVTFSDIEGKPRTYDASFSCVKGARILWLGGTGYFRLEQ
jgi:hypothetical protein